MENCTLIWLLRNQISSFLFLLEEILCILKTLEALELTLNVLETQMIT